jgi:pyrroline-5-carboxylate reductase
MLANWSPDAPIWLVGCGNMAGAMLGRWLDVGLPPGGVTVVRPSGAAPAPGVRTLTALPRDESPPRVLMLGVKPQMLDAVADQVSSVLGLETLLISILAGTELASLRARFPRAGAIVRAMPNTPVAIGRGVVALHGDVRPEVAALMQPLGLIEWTVDEEAFGAVTALAGSGPAFLFRFVSALAHAGEALGLDPAQALRLAKTTVDGAAGLAAASADHPDTLVDRVASAGGMTRKGLDVLDQDHALDTLVLRTIEATERRGREMASATRLA